jgi:acyl-coenzyme A synthetase/AMP-(fatty) acid ligase
MLYAAWQEIVRARQNELALADLGSGQRWTFGQVAEAAAALTADDPVIFPCEAGPAFVFEVARAWQCGKTVCPLDQGQNRPALDTLPAGCVHLKTTSGTAGAPRLIAFTARQLMADVNNIVETMGLRPDWPNLGVISLAHSYGFSNLVLPLLLRGIPLVLAPSRLPEALRQAARQFECLTLPAVPALWRVWRDANVLSPSIKLAISAGAAFPSALEREIFERDGLKVHNFYGASECGGICFDASPAPRACDEDVGSPLRGVQLTTDSEGRLVVTSEAVGQTYWPSPDAALGCGKFRASDLVELRDGRVLLQGRHSEIINIAGQKVAPETIEQTILRHPEVRECVVFSAPDHGNVRSEMIVACVAGEPSLDPSALKRFVTEHLPSWQAPRQWWIVPTLTDSTRGKISRAQWRQRFLAEKKL